MPITRSDSQLGGDIDIDKYISVKIVDMPRLAKTKPFSRQASFFQSFFVFDRPCQLG